MGGRWPGPGTALERSEGRCRDTPALPGALPNLSPGCLRQDLIRLQPNSRICHQPGSGEGSQLFHDRQRHIRGKASVCPSVCSDVASGACWAGGSRAWRGGAGRGGTVHKRVHTGTGSHTDSSPMGLEPKAEGLQNPIQILLVFQSPIQMSLPP